MKKILFAASECVPFVKTGGLADVVGSLPKAFDRKKYDIRVILPAYKCIKPQYREKLEYVLHFWMDDRIYVGIFKTEIDGITFYFVDNEQYFSGPKPYVDLYTDLERFAYFSKAVLSALPLLGFRPDIIHCHDWQSSLIPVYLHTLFRGSEFFDGIKTIMTIHNLRFQGTWNAGHLQWVSGLPWEVFVPGKLVSPYQDERIPQAEWTASMLRGGLVYCDYITTVSETYAKEIQTDEFGDGLQDILRWRSDRLIGIVNGIDFDMWNPKTDKDVLNNYYVTTVKKQKALNKVALQKELGLPEDPKVFTLGIISRLTDQKGLDLVDHIMDRLVGMKVNFVVLGTGDPAYENMFRYYQGKYPDKVAAVIDYQDALSHRIYSAVDVLMVPSAFEPCGLTQLISLRYGTVPLVHEVGGLKDTVKPFNEYENLGTGFSFRNYSSEELLDRINHAAWCYYERPDLWKDLQKRGMKEDWSWTKSAEVYRDLYENV